MGTLNMGVFRNGMRPIHPGEVLQEEFLEPLGMTAGKLAEFIRVTPARIYEIVSGKRGITANTAMKLSRALGTTAEMWMNLQIAYDIRMEEISVGNKIQTEVNLLPQLQYLHDD